jgi:hypothetical protein
MTDPRTPARSILDASPGAARWAWIINGSLFAIGASVSTFVYLSGRGGEEIMRVGRVGDAWGGSVESNLFPFPFFQLVLFLIPLFIDLNWRGFQSVVWHSEQLRCAQDVRYQAMDIVLLYVGVCLVLVVGEIVVFGMALSTAWSVYAWLDNVESRAGGSMGMSSYATFADFAERLAMVLGGAI